MLCSMTKLKEHSRGICYSSSSLSIISYHNMSPLITAGVAVLLTIITYFSSPILTTIFGDGSLEVRGHKSEASNTEELFSKPCFQPGGGHRGLGLYRAYRNGGKQDKCDLQQSFLFSILSPGDVRGSEQF